MEEYIKLLLEQIRCKKVHPYIREEIEGHIEEQIAENIRLGMSEKEAEKAAVEDMGSPVEVGISLDRIHRPQIAWGIIILMAIISLAGIILQMVIEAQTGIHKIDSMNYAMNVISGFIIMLMVYRIDYSVIARYSKIIAVFLLGICGLSFFIGTEINGCICYVEFLGIQISVFSIMLLYVPLYGAVIYKYYGLGYKAFFKCILWMVIPVVMAYRLPDISLAFILLLSMAMVLTVAVMLGWFPKAKKKTIFGLWGTILGLPLLLLGFAWRANMLASYQIKRITAFFTGGDEYNYITSVLRLNLQKSQLWGSNGEDLKYFFEIGESYLFSHVLSAYGQILATVILGILIFLILQIFLLSFQQKNQVGMCMGCGCGMVLLLNIILNIGINMGWIPLTRSFLPFFSSGENNIVICYILVGIILSIYRYKNIYPAKISTYSRKCY